MNSIDIRASRPATVALADLTVRDGVALVRAGEVKPSEWMSACLDVAAGLEPRLHAWSYLDPTKAMTAADALDGIDWDARRTTPRLAGVPFGVKDIFNSRDMPTQRGSAYWEAFLAGNDARVVERAKWCGAAVMGKTATAEFGVHAPPPTVNPWSNEHIAGTSSTGSAVAVLTGMTPLALGTQSAGSIIRPASYVGVLGFKPSFGLIPRTGVLKTCDSLDTLGWFARAVADLRIALDALRVGGHNHPNVERGLGRAEARRRGGQRWKLALIIPPTWETATEQARSLLEEYANQVGNRPDMDVTLLDLHSEFAQAHETHRVIYHKSLSHYFKDEAQKPELLSPIFRSIIEEGKGITLGAYADALDRQADLARRLTEKMDGFDAGITLSVAGEAPTLAAPEEPRDSALIWTLCGVPSLSIPVLKGTSGMPVGVQLIAPRYGDYQLLQLGETLFPQTLPRWRPGI